MLDIPTFSLNIFLIYRSFLRYRIKFELFYMADMLLQALKFSFLAGFFITVLMSCYVFHLFAFFCLSPFHLL